MASHTTPTSGDRLAGQAGISPESAARSDVARLNDAIALAMTQASMALARAQAPEAVGQAARNMAHEFNNLLTVLQNSVDLLRMPNLAAERRDRYLNAIEASTDRATKLTRQMQELARALAPRQVITDLSARLDQLARGSGFRRAPRSPDLAAAMTAHIDPAGFDAVIAVMAAAWRKAEPMSGQLELMLEEVNGPLQADSQPMSANGWAAITFFTPTADTSARSKLMAQGLLAALPGHADMAPEWLQALSFIEKSGGLLRARALENGALGLTFYLPRNILDDAGQAAMMRGISA